MSEKAINTTPLSNEEKRLMSLVDDHQDELISLLQDLVKFNSVTTEVDQFSDLSDIFSYTEGFFKKAGIATKFFNCPHLHDSKNSDKIWQNLIATLDGGKPGKTLQLNGHLDIVPYSEDNWSEGLAPLTPIVKDGKMYGRGTADMKGGVASMMMAAKLLKKAGYPINGKLKVWLVPDEEINARYGAHYMVTRHLNEVQADMTIIAEPTGQPPIQSPAIVLGEKGHAWMKLIFHGAAGHGSAPKPKSNALNKAAKFVTNGHKWKPPKTKPPVSKLDLIKGILGRFTVKNLINSLGGGDGPKDPYNDDGFSMSSFFTNSMSVNTFKSGSKINVIPDTAEIEIDVRILPGVSYQDIYSSYANYAAKLGYRMQLPEGYLNPQKSKAKLMKRPIDIELIAEESTLGSYVPPNGIVDELGQAFEDVYHRKRVYFFANGSTDAAHMREKGMKNTIVLGPSGLHTHDANEYVSIEHLIKICKVYLLMAYRMLCNS